MPKAEYEWEVGSPALLEPHSVAKHTILRRYVEEYIQILTADPRVPEFRLTLIDGFAGGGEIGAYAKGPEAQALRIQKSLHIYPHLRSLASYVLTANWKSGEPPAKSAP